MAADSSTSKGIAENSERRLHIIREIRETEESYVEKLNLIVQLFWGPLHVNPILDKSEMDAIFSNITELRRINLELLSTLREHRSNPGLAFTRLAPFLRKFYAQYAENFNRAVSTLQECTHRNTEFAGFKLSQESRPACQALKLEGYLIMPIQRIPRYRLLLKDLLRHTPEKHPDYPMLNTSYEQMCEVASHINEYIRKHENFEKMLTIQQSLSGVGDYRILMPGRNFLREGRLMKVCRKKNKERVIFLFTDQLVYAKPRTRQQGAKKEAVSGTHVFRAALPLVSCSVTSLSQHPRVPNITPLLMIECQSSSLVLFSPDANEINGWLRALQSAIQELRQTHEYLIDQLSKHSSRSFVLTNTMLKSARRVKNQLGEDESGTIPLLSASPTSIQSDYPLRYSVMSQQEEDEEDDIVHGAGEWTGSLEALQRRGDSVSSTGDGSLPLDMGRSLDVDDLLHALASMDSMDDTETETGDGVATRHHHKPQHSLSASHHHPAAAPLAVGPTSSSSGGVQTHVASNSAGQPHPQSMRPTEKFTRDGSLQQHQVLPSSQSAASGRGSPRGGNIHSSGLYHDPVQPVQQLRLSGQGPSFRRKPAMKETHSRNARQHDSEQVVGAIGSATASAAGVISFAGAPVRSHTLERIVGRADSEGILLMKEEQQHSRDVSVHSRQASHTRSLDRPHSQTGTGTDPRRKKTDRNDPIDTEEIATPRGDAGRTVQNASPDRHQQPPTPDQHQQPPMQPNQSTSVGTLRKQQQVRTVSHPLKLVATDSGRLSFDEEHPVASTAGTATAEVVAVRSADSGHDNGDGLWRECSRPDAGVKDTTALLPADRNRERNSVSKALHQQQPPGDDPVTELGCGALRTTTYSFETGTAQSSLCLIL